MFIHNKGFCDKIVLQIGECMSEIKQRKAAKEFAEFWKDKGYEKGQSQAFWLSLLRDVYEVEHPEQFISFEDQVHLDNTSFIDGYIAQTRVMIEQKSLGKNLKQAIKQSDGTLLSPFQQAKRYITELPVSKHPKYVVTCNFEEFYVYDMEQPNGEPEIVKLKDLEKEYYRLSFLTKTEDIHLKKEMEVSIKAGEIVGVIYDALLKQYINKESEITLHSLNILCVRLVFCLFAEDAEIFGKRDMFLDYMKQFETKHFRKALLDLFRVLNTPIEERDPYLEPELAKFPYVNGGLFAENNIEIPLFTDEIRELILKKASEDFDWSKISPTIFGAVFESTLNPDTRRKGGMHYTSIENIHKVIDPLFMDNLNKEFLEIKEIKQDKTKNIKLKEFQGKIANLTFLDPACGSGNFLTETYISLRKLENDILFELQKGQIKMGLVTNPIQVSIKQFYGIEINDFAVTVAKTALWIAESQMMKQTEDIVHMNLDFLPLKTYTNIIEANALRIDWETVVPKEKLNYIMGNPPFVGQSVRSKEQSYDMSKIFGSGSIETKLDYVICWYYIAIKYMKNTSIKCALVSTNSICQGESVPTFWRRMIESGTEIQFAHQTFRWDSEASLKAHVHCVIVGFTFGTNNNEKLLYRDSQAIRTKHINGYLLNAPDVWLENRINKKNGLLPKMTTGSPPTDDGGLLLSIEEKKELLKKYPNIENCIKPFIGAREFLHDKTGAFSRYCLWLKNVPLKEYKNIKELELRFEKVKAIRLKSNADRINKMADYPYLFCQCRQPKTDYIVIPRHSSERRRYIPMGFMQPHIIAGDACTILPNADLYLFAILMSNVHNAWMRTVCGRLKNDYRYSPTVYNNFIWCEPTDVQKAKIELTARSILDARAKYPECSLADLYDELTMPPELRKAHQENDKAVMEAYGFYKTENNKRTWFTESETVSKLMQMYQDKINELNKKI